MMTSIPQCTYCKYGKIENGIIICKQRKIIPEKIQKGIELCKYHEKSIKTKA